MATLFDKLDHHWRRFFFSMFRKKHFKQFAHSATLIRHLKLQGTEYITVEPDVYIHDLVWLGAYKTGIQDPVLSIGSGTTLGHFNHITATQSVIIGKNVLTADKVYISDHLHEYEDIHVPIKDQPIRQKKSVTIGDGAWLGENVVVMGASVGKNSVIGSNSVVTRDIPDYCVAVGSPAKVIKKYSTITERWDVI